MKTKTQHAARWVVLAAVVLGIVMFYLGVHAGRRALRGDVSDFRAYYTAAAEMRAGRDPYAPNERPYLYPPFIGFLCMPLTSLPMERAALLYLPLLLAASMASLYLAPKIMLNRLGAGEDKAVTSQAILITMVLILDRLRMDTQMFQVNTLMLLLFTMGLCWLDRKPWLAGSALGMALNIKGQSIVMLPYLLIRRRWSAAAAMVLSAVFFAIIPAAATGWNANLKNLGSLFGGIRALGGTQTPAQASTHLTDAASMVSISATSGVARLLKQEGLSAWLWPVMALIIAGFFLFALWAYRDAGIPMVRWPVGAEQTGQPWKAVIATEWACLIMAVMVFNPQTNSRHFVSALIPMALAAAALRKPVARKPWWLMLLGLAVLFAGLTLPPGSREISWLFDLKSRWSYIGGPSWVMLVAIGLFLLAGLQTARSMMNCDRQDSQSPTKPYPSN